MHRASINFRSPTLFTVGEQSSPCLYLREHIEGRKITIQYSACVLMP